MKKELFNEADFLQNLLDAVPSFLFIVDSDLRIHHLNSPAMKLLNSGMEAIPFKRGGEILDCIHSHETPEGCGGAASCRDCVIRNSVVQALRGERVYREFAEMTLLADGKPKEICLSITASPFEYAGETFTLLVLEDITKEKELEEALRQHAAKLEASYRDMESFSYSASHDLRAPLRAIGSFADILLQDAADRLDGQDMDLLHSVRTNAEKMEHLVDDMLAFFRTDSREIQMHEIDMEVLVEDVLDELKMTAGSSNVRFEIGCLPRACGDYSMIRQVFVNLLANAIKFTRTVEQARIEVGSEMDKQETVYFVRDNGVGFDMKEAGRLFGFFSRLHTYSQFEGTGLGLVIVKKIVEKHGGRVWADGKPGGGATFFLTLPRAGD